MRVRVVIAQNHSTRMADLLGALNLPADVVVTSAEWGAAKPSPDFFHQVIGAAQAPADETMYLGDHPQDAVSPRSPPGCRPPTCAVGSGATGRPTTKPSSGPPTTRSTPCSTSCPWSPPPGARAVRADRAPARARARQRASALPDTRVRPAESEALTWAYLVNVLFHVAGAAGFEPAAFGFGDRRSDQLSYTPSVRPTMARSGPEIHCFRCSTGCESLAGVGAGVLQPYDQVGVLAGQGDVERVSRSWPIQSISAPYDSRCRAVGSWPPWHAGCPLRVQAGVVPANRVGLARTPWSDHR